MFGFSAYVGNVYRDASRYEHRDPALVLDVSVLLTEPACVLSGQEELLKSVYRFWVKPGSVRKPNLPGLGDPFN